MSTDAAYMRDYYARNPEYRETKKQHRRDFERSNRDFVDEYKAKHPCPCGEGDPDCLVFHHLRDKKYSVSQMMNRKRETIEAEIAKCIVLCANCHIKWHKLNGRAF